MRTLVNRPIDNDMRCAFREDAVGPSKPVYPMMPREFRPLVLPSQFHLSAKHQYIPNFDAVRNRCWWEPLQQSCAAEAEDEGWTFYSKRTRSASSKTPQDDDDEDSDVDGSYAQDTTNSPEDQAWAAFLQENSRREALAQKWMDKNMR